MESKVGHGAAHRDVVAGHLERNTCVRGGACACQALIDYLEGGETIDDFVAGFPTVRREQVVAFLEEATARMISQAS